MEGVAVGAAETEGAQVVAANVGLTVGASVTAATVDGLAVTFGRSIKVTGGIDANNGDGVGT